MSRAGGSFRFAAFSGLLAACGSEPARVDVPAPTSARPASSVEVISTPAPKAPLVVDAGAPAPPAPAAEVPASGVAPPARFVKSGDLVKSGLCERALLAATRGKLVVDVVGPGGRTEQVALDRGDVLVTVHAEELRSRGEGAGVAFAVPMEHCAVLSHPGTHHEVVRGAAARELRWAGGAMRAHLDVRAGVSSELYVGRLEGTAPVAEHVHAGSTEVLAALEGAGTFTLEGRPLRLVAPQIVVVPPGAKHAWTPDPGTKLVAVQAYGPPGPEQRFVALDAADRDAGAPR